MVLKKSIWGILTVISFAFWVTHSSLAQSTSCTVDIVGSTVTGNLAVGSPVTFTVQAMSTCGGDLYYKYFYQAGYGTSSYGNNWVSMISTNYVTDNQVTHTFGTAGKYIVVAWASADPNNFDPTSVAIIGYSVEISATGGTACPVDIQGLNVSGVLAPNIPVNFRVDAAARCGGNLCYKYFCKASYGTADYATSPWVSMISSDYVTANTITYNFPSAGSYIVIAWASSDPNSFDPNGVSLIGTSITLTSGANPSVLFDLGEAQVEMPETGNVLMEITEEGGIGSATYYGTQTAGGPDLPLTGFTATTGSGNLNGTFDSQERATQFTLGSLQGAFTYNPDETFNYEVRKNGQVIFSGNNLITEISTSSGSTRLPSGFDTLSAKGKISAPLNRSVSGEVIAMMVQHIILDEARTVSQNPAMEESDPFVQSLRGNSDFVRLVDTRVILHLMAQRLPDPDGCRGALSEGECWRRRWAQFNAIYDFMYVIDTAILAEIEKQWFKFIGPTTIGLVQSFPGSQGENSLYTRAFDPANGTYRFLRSAGVGTYSFNSDFRTILTVILV